VGLLLGATALAMAGGRSKELPLRLAFDSAAFFTYALPPIILDAGLRVDTRLFFHNILRIFTLGVFVTVVCFAVTSAMVNVFLSAYDLPLRSQLAVGAVFGATDTVATLAVLSERSAPRLFSIVLGEGCVNDAMSLVLLRAVESLPEDGGTARDVLFLSLHFVWLFAASTILGMLVGLAAAAVAKLVSRPGPGQQASPVALEVALLFLWAYLAFLVAEVCRLSGILALFAASLVMSHYALRSISRGAHEATVASATTLATVCEQLIFISTGMAVLDARIWQQARAGEVLAITATLGTLLLLTRALAVFPALAAGNMLSRNTAREQISRACACLAGAVLCLRLLVFVTVRESAVIWWAGSTRGAVSIAIATHHFAVAPPMARTDDPAKAELQRSNASVIAAATLIVLTSSICFSGLTRPFLARVLPSALAGAAEASAELYSSLAEDEAPSPRSNWLFRAWDAVDRRYLAPVLGSEASEHARLIHSGHTTELLERGAAEGDDNGDGMS